MKYKIIKNTTRYYSEGYTKTGMKVPDYNCSAARLQRQQDMSLRLSAEIDRYNNAGGSVIFITLTYNDLNLPMFCYNHMEDEKKIPCFNQEHITDFVRKIERWCKWNCPSYKADVERKGDIMIFKYAIACEYGNGYEYLSDRGDVRNGTTRPHYHALLFFPPSVHKDMTFTKYRQVLLSAWSGRGFIRWSKDFDGSIKLFVDSEFAGIYASKYACKDLNFWANPTLNEYIKDENGSIIKARVNELKDKGFLPKFRQSQHVGECLKDKFQTYEDFRDGVDFHFQSEVKKGVQVKHKAPLYIQRKTLLYYDRKEERYKHTQKGIDYKVRMFIDGLPENSRKLMAQCTELGLMQKLTLVELKAHKDELLGFDNFSDLSAYITSILSRMGPEYYLLYQKVYSGLAIRRRDFWVVDNFIRYSSLNDFVFSSVEILSRQLDNDKYDICIPLGYFAEFKPPLNQLYYDDLPVFRDFNTLDLLFGIIDDIYHERCQRLYDAQRLERKLHVLAVS